MRKRCWTFVLWIVMVTGAALFVGSGLLYWQGVSAVEDRSGAGSMVENREGEVAVGEFDVTEPLPVSLAAGEEVGEIYFPVLEVSIPVFHGVSEEELARGVGHVPGTLLPGGGGNIVLSGHRDTVFRRLEELEVGDKVVFGFGGAAYTYKISRIKIVDKEDTSVVVPRPREVLTITTCYPFGFIGRAPERYVLEAEFIGGEME
ncbi:class D sortase [Sutcliffiella horikoshii]|uniref:class D sortase n=1 Tax=Sutcliffiella horikoshii TaxID=79883 RepID=UPI001CBEC061|nr:class D sortase [Sutcliffiella horikoshii]UAL47068.1 class D sortase [Sutcliffiella horikoshii]